MPETATATEKYQNDMPTGMPDITVSVRQTFGIDSDLQVPAFSKSNDYVPDLDDVLATHRLLTATLPPTACTRCLTIDSPSPVPPKSRERCRSMR